MTTARWDTTLKWVKAQPTLRWTVDDRRELPAYTLDPFPNVPPITIAELLAMGYVASVGPTASVLLCTMVQDGFGDVEWDDMAHRLGVKVDTLQRTVVRLIMKFRWANDAERIVVALPLRLAERVGAA